MRILDFSHSASHQLHRKIISSVSRCVIFCNSFVGRSTTKKPLLTTASAFHRRYSITARFMKARRIKKKSTSFLFVVDNLFSRTIWFKCHQGHVEQSKGKPDCSCSEATTLRESMARAGKRRHPHCFIGWWDSLLVVSRQFLQALRGQHNCAKKQKTIPSKATEWNYEEKLES